MGSLVISLDFELIWGLLHLSDVRQKVNLFLRTHEVVERTLDLFRSYEISATWASVGMLLCDDWESWGQASSTSLPDYANESLCPYRFVRENRDLDAGCYFAPECIQRIISTPGQELATHTFSHYYCLEEGQDIAHFEADLEAAVLGMSELGVVVESLVFPRNQFRREYLQACANKGITSVRVNPECWYWRDVKSSSFITKSVRTLDCYLPFKRQSTAMRNLCVVDGVLLQPASRFLRPKLLGLADKLRNVRVKAEMLRAAERDEIYHLWWHPHNLAGSVDQSILELEEICKFFSQLRHSEGMESMAMADVRRCYIDRFGCLA